MSPLRGITLKLLSVCIFVAMSSLIKITSDYVPPGQAVFFRSFFALPVIMVWLTYRHELHIGLKTQNPMSHVWRGLVGTTAMGLSFTGLGLLPLPEVTAIGYAAPILVVIFAAMFLGEQVRVFRLSMVAFGLAGVLVVLSPRLAVDPETANAQETLGAVVVLLAAVCAALAQVFVRKMVQTESTSAIVFYFSLTATAMSLLTLPWGWAVPPAWVLGAANPGGTSRGRGPDPPDLGLPLCRCLADRAIRIRLDAAGDHRRLHGVLRSAHRYDADRRGHDHDGGRPDHLARTPTRP
jgi:drug/metabolite transporter (DMT)-like permease